MNSEFSLRIMDGIFFYVSLICWKCKLAKAADGLSGHRAQVLIRAVTSDGGHDVIRAVLDWFSDRGRIDGGESALGVNSV